MQVMVETKAMVTHFRRLDQFSGLSGSSGPSQSTEFDRTPNICKLVSSLRDLGAIGLSLFPFVAILRAYFKIFRSSRVAVVVRGNVISPYLLPRKDGVAFTRRK